MELLHELEENQNIVLVLKEHGYKDSVLRINKKLATRFQSICYVTSTEPASAKADVFSKNGIDSKKYYFVDCVSKKTVLKAESSQTAFVSSPTAVTSLGIAVSKALEERKTDLLFLDSVSTLLIYNSELPIVKFLHFLMNKIRGTKSKAIYLILKSDLEKRVVKEIELFADKILEYEFLE